MAAYLIDHPPKVQQWYAERRRPLTGCTVIHTAESVMDTVGPDTGAENVASFIQGRNTAGSYHDLVDSDSWLRLVPLERGAFHDGTGSNNWALSLSFACATSDWRRMTPAKRAAFLRNGARAFAAQQAWRKAHGYPLTELRLITKAQSDAGLSGFIYHGLRDPGRRSDPGVAAPNLFPLKEFLDHCRAALAGTAPQQQEDDMTPDQAATLQRTSDILERLLTEFMGPDGRDADARSDETGIPTDTRGRRTLQQVLTDIHHEVTVEVPSRVPGSKYKATVLNYAANADGYGYAISQQLAGLQAAVDHLAAAVAQGGGASAEELKAVVQEAMASTVKLEVSLAASSNSPTA